MQGGEAFEKQNFRYCEKLSRIKNFCFEFRNEILWSFEIVLGNFLRQRVETKLAALYVQAGIYSKAEAIIIEVSREVKKLDDKLLLCEIHLIESILLNKDEIFSSKIIEFGTIWVRNINFLSSSQFFHFLSFRYFDVNNVPKSKAALTASKTKANAIHCPPLLQAEIDLRSGMLCMREKDFNTAYSYFYEAFEAFHQATDKRAAICLKYMLLDRVMQEQPDEVSILAAGKTFLKYLGAESDALLAIAKALKARSLKDFENSKIAHDKVISADETMKHHIDNLYETMLQQNLLRITEPYSQIQLSQVAKLIDLPTDLVQDKLSEMILDCKFQGTLDQGKGVVIVFDKEPIASCYENCLKSINNTSDVMNNMARKAQLLV